MLKILKVPLIGTLAMLLAAVLPLPVQAKEWSGSIRVVLEETKSRRPRENVELALYRLADLKDGDLDYLEPYRELAAPITDLQKPSVVRTIKEKARKVMGEPEQMEKSSEKGIVIFDGLDPGLYFIHVNNPAEYDRIGDLLVCLPAWNETEGVMEDHVSIYAKAIEIPDLLIEKVDENRQPIKNKEFSFTAYKDEQLETVRSVSKGDPQTGTARFRLNLGETVYIKETGAPEGYALASTVIRVDLSEDGQLFINQKPVAPVDGVFRILFVNQPKKPDQPGNENRSAPRSAAPSATGVHSGACQAAIGALAALSVMILLFCRKKKT